MKELVSQQFFSLLFAGLRREPVRIELFQSSEEVDWILLLRISEEQTVVAVVWDGIMSLPKELHPSGAIWYRWYTIVVRIEKRNEQLNALIPEIVQQGSAITGQQDRSELCMVLLKGQGTAALYPNPLHRTCGDIDVYAGKDFQFLEEYFSTKGFQRTGNSEKHSEYMYKGVMVENHRYVALFFCPWLAYRLRKLVGECFSEELPFRRIGHEEVRVFPPWFEALFGVIHFRTHLHLEGIGWRQLCDWWLIKQQLLREEDESRAQYMRYKKGLRALRLKRMEELMEELCTKLWVEESTQERLSSAASMIYREMWQGGNFGYHAVDAHDHSFAARKGFWKTMWNLGKHDVIRSIRFFRIFPEEAFFSPAFRLGGYLRRRGR